MNGGLSKEVISDVGEINMGRIHICDQQSWSYERGDLSRGWSPAGGTTVPDRTACL